MTLLTTLLVLLSSVAGAWPLDPRPQVVRPFQPPTEPWGAGHRGVDLLGEAGQEVDAAAPGTITFAGRLAGIGIVVVTHGDTRTTYQPVSTSVVPGELVGAGQPIGRLELAGSHCFPRACLHWGLIKGAEYLDPLTMIGTTPRVRLLPLGGPATGPPAEASARQVTASIAQLLSAGFGIVTGPSAPLRPGGVPAGTPSAADPP